MQRKESKLRKSPVFLYVEGKITSFLPVNRNGWIIKLSTVNRGNILLVFLSKQTGQTIVRYFTEEDDAVQFINFIIEHDPNDKVIL